MLTYQALLSGGIIPYDYTDMITSEIVSTHKLGKIVGWGWVSNILYRTVTFLCRNRFSSGTKRVEVLLVGYEHSEGQKNWRLLKIVTYTDPQGDTGLTEIPILSLSEIQDKRIKAENTILFCQVQQELLRLTDTTLFPAEL